MRSPEEGTILWAAVSICNVFEEKIRTHLLLKSGSDFYIKKITGLDMHFCPEGKNRRSHQCLHWWQQPATGRLHVNGFESVVDSKK